MNTDPTPISYQHTPAANVLGVSPRTLARWRKKGLVKTVKVENVILYPRTELMKLIGMDEKEISNGNIKQS